MILSDLFYVETFWNAPRDGILIVILVSQLHFLYSAVDFSLYEKDELRALFILLQNPVFFSQSSYTVLAHLLRQITQLPNTDHQILVQWFRT